MRATRDRPLAEALLEETYRRLTADVRAGREPAHLRAWLYRIASSLVVEPPRRRLSAWLRPPDSPHPGVGGGLPATDMDQVLEGLSPEARLALLLSGEGFAGPEIAEAIGRSAAATRTLLGLARVRVRVRRELFANAAR